MNTKRVICCKVVGVEPVLLFDYIKGEVRTVPADSPELALSLVQPPQQALETKDR
jgi:hypothetical protein